MATTMTTVSSPAPVAGTGGELVGMSKPATTSTVKRVVVVAAKSIADDVLVIIDGVEGQPSSACHSSLVLGLALRIIIAAMAMRTTTSSSFCVTSQQWK